MRIGPDPLTSPEIIAFLQAHLDQMREISPPESVHALDLDGLRAPGVWFHSAYDRAAGGPVGVDELVGCGALKRLDEAAVELKSMRTAPHRQGEGIASRLLVHLLDQARQLGFGRINLETGAEDFFAPARRLYERHGFVVCEPFGDYRPDPLSVFMTREL
ncbi:GNAT family N-acetyltransferase [Nocardioides sp. R-C-SC26]|uniref:GNAT family N-acetyltransferase n=1 Tax=Nocardioides sp. R-C-SC26 TaxID=2870414 RepID=UPI001E62F404|nr:GNAT family N-acetyltransferase [Nocardioides sp. R-C-SC26]